MSRLIWSRVFMTIGSTVTSAWVNAAGSFSIVAICCRQDPQPAPSEK